MPQLRRTTLSGYSEFFHYSVIHDKDMVRLSLFDERGREFFMMVPAHEGKSYRERRTEALETIQSAMAAHLEPGQVRVTNEA